MAGKFELCKNSAGMVHITWHEELERRLAER